ncbi:MAG: methylmalonyl-CoA mutase small subunit [Bacteroidales bacterium]
MDQKEKDSQKLFSEFPPISTEKWEEKIRTDLKGADFERKLVWRSPEGFNVYPFYRNEDLDKVNYLDSLPGEFPYARGNKKDNNNWFVRQDIKIDDYKEANKKALNILMRGIESLGFEMNSEVKPSEENLEQLLNDIVLDAIELNFKTGEHSMEIIPMLVDIAKKKNVDLAQVKGSMDFDPLKCLTLRGKFVLPQEEIFAKAVALTKAAAELPEFKTIGVNGLMLSNSGASIVQELGMALAMGAEYIAQLTEQGLSVDEAASRIRFNFGVGSNYFMELAKFRAARILWAHIIEAFGGSKEAAKMSIHVETSDWNKTVYDPYVNMLRTTTEAMSSVLAGIDSLVVRPFNASFEETTEFSERIARNQQLLLKEESYFNKIVDPAAGSYYIETLTDKLAEEAWKVFLAIDEKGGYIAALRAGFIQNEIKATQDKRAKSVATRRENFLGTNQYPNFNEVLEHNIPADVLQPKDSTVEGAEFETLKPYRGSQAFESLRSRVENHSRTTGKRPKAFMLTMGNLAMRKARATFACNFFGCAGFEGVDNLGFASVEEGAKAAIDAQADIVVICSSDDEYAEIAPAAFELLKDKAIVVVAGAPACANDLKAVGIEHFVNVKTNVLEGLEMYAEKLGIK